MLIVNFIIMNIHEYQGKAILRQFGVSIPEGTVVKSPDKAVEAAKEIRKKTGNNTWAVKAQIHAGGRGKGGGVKIAKSLDEVKQYAKDIGLNTAKFDACLNSGKYTNEVKEDFKDGQKAGVSGTPTFYINGQELVGAQPFEAFQQIIEQELNK